MTHQLLMSPLETAQSFMASWAIPGNFEASFRQYLTPDCVYENVGLSRTVGPDEALAFLAGFSRQVPFVAITMDLLSIAVAGDMVLTERIDYLQDADGKTLLAIPLMGAMKIRHGKVCEWRDYFDTAPFAR